MTVFVRAAAATCLLLLLASGVAGAQPASGQAPAKDPDAATDQGGASGLSVPKDPNAGPPQGGASGLSVPKDPNASSPQGGASGLAPAKEPAPQPVGGRALSSLQSLGRIDSLFANSHGGDKLYTATGSPANLSARPAPPAAGQGGQGSAAGGAAGTQAKAMTTGGTPAGGGQLGNLGASTTARIDFAKGAAK